MPRRRLRVDVSPELRQWAAGLGGLSITPGAVGEWRQVGERFFDRSQQFVHVITADLKTTGENRTFIEGRRIVTETTYGGRDVDYAPFEFGRGGEHDALGRAWEETSDLFAPAARRAVTRAVEEAV